MEQNRIPELAELIAAGITYPTIDLGEVGNTVSGTIVTARSRQAGEANQPRYIPAFWADGSPKLNVVLVVKLDDFTPGEDDDEDDDGTRQVFINWWGGQRKSFLAAVQDANDTTMRPGGHVEITMTGRGVPKVKGKDAKGERIYEIVYRGPRG